MGKNTDINRISNPLTANMNANMNADALEEARLRYDRSTHRPTLRRQASKITAEQAMRNYIRQTYRDRIRREIAAPRRGPSPRADPVFDGLFELDNGEFIVAEGKGGGSYMANTRVGKQFSPEWFSARLDELDKLGKKLGEGSLEGREARELAEKLRTAWGNGKITALSIHSPGEFEVPKAGKNIKVVRIDSEYYMVDETWTEKWNKYRGVESQAKPLVDYQPSHISSDATKLPSAGHSPAASTTSPGVSKSNQITDVERGLASPQRVVAHKPNNLPAHVKLPKPGVEAFLAASKAKSFALGVKAWHVTRNLGSLFISTFLPLTALDLVLEIAFYLLELWLTKEARWEEKKRRALLSVLRDRDVQIESLIQSEILNRDKGKLVESFMNSWNDDDDPSVSGFLYARLEAKLEYGLYFDVLDVKIMPTIDQHEFELIEVNEEKEDPRKKYVTKYILRYTLTPPLITPFDIVITKINNLFLDMISFIGAFSKSSEEYMRGFSGFNYRKSYQDQFENLPVLIDFPDPLNKALCERSLRHLLSVAGRLSQHPIKRDELRNKTESPVDGYLRRGRLIGSLTERPDPGSNDPDNFSTFLSTFNRLVKDSAKAPKEIQDAIKELYTGGRQIWYNLVRIDKDLQMNPEYYYYGPKYKQNSKS